MAGYVGAKKRIFRHQGADDVAILGGDDARVMELAQGLKGRRRSFGQDREAEARISGSKVMVSRKGQEESFELEGTRLDSAVNRLNSAAAILAVQSVGAGAGGIEKGLAAYRPPPHRMALVAEINGVVYINDSKATNVGAMGAALASCPSGVILIAGGRDKDGDFSSIHDLVGEKVRQLLCLGEAGSLLRQVFADVVPTELVNDMEAAVQRAASLAKPGQTVLLAPGCASFDMFSGYAERGEVFTRLVHALAGQGNGGR